MIHNQSTLTKSMKLTQEVQKVSTYLLSKRAIFEDIPNITFWYRIILTQR